MAAATQWQREPGSGSALPGQQLLENNPAIFRPRRDVNREQVASLRRGPAPTQQAEGRVDPQS